MMGINGRFLMLQALNCIVLLAWIGLSVSALLGLRRQRLSDVARVIWVLVILVIPIMGAVSYWIVRPGAEDQGGVG